MSPDAPLDTSDPQPPPGDLFGRRSQEPTATIRQLIPPVSALLRYGVDPASLLRRFHLPDADSLMGEQRITQTVLCDFWDACARVSGDAAFGLRIGIRCETELSPAVPPVMVHLARHAETLRDVIDVIIRYERLCEEGRRGELTLDGSRAIWSWRAVHGARFSRAFSEHVLAGLCHPARWARRDPAVIELLEVHFPLGAPTDLALYQAHFGVPLRFDCGYQALVFSRRSLEARAPAGDATLTPLLSQLADHELDRVPSIACFAARVRSELAQRSEGGPVALSVMARRLGVGERTLRRRLAEESTSYYELVDEWRRARAQALIGDRRLSLTELALLLGFSEQNSFARAYRRWFGVAPGAERKRGDSRP